MRWYISYPILAAGLAFALDTLYPHSPDFSRPAPADAAAAVLDRGKQPIVVLASQIADVQSRVAAFSPSFQLVSTAVAAPKPSVLDYLARKLTLTSEPDPAPETLQPVTVTAWTSAIVREPAPVSARAMAREPVSKVALARDIQRELQRVGCYAGEIDGVWGRGSKRAVLYFMDRVNAALPTRDPDVFMLSLLKAQTAAVCGASCPRGQSITASGRCSPSTLVAKATLPATPNPAGASWEAQVAEAPTGDRAVPYGRMSIGGPKPDDVAQFAPELSRSENGGSFARTAAVEDLPTPSDELAVEPPVTADASAFDTDAVAAVKASRPSARAKARARAQPRTATYRHVQRLFEHPLGRM